MPMNINFPNLGIYLDHVGKRFSVFGFEIAFYGLIIGIGVLSGVLMAAYLAKKTGQNPDTYYDLAIYAIIFSVIGARLYYVIFSWDSYKNDLISIFNIRGGGLAIYGAVIAAVITVFLYCKIKKHSFALLADTGAPALILGQIIGRWGNFFNREAFGGYTDNLFAMQIPVDAVNRSKDLTAEMLENMTMVDGINYVQVHPTFLYESLWNVGVLILMLLLTKRKKFNGQIVLTYMIGYGIGRFWIEGLRTDQLLVPGTNIAVSQMLGLALAVGCGIVMIVKLIRLKKSTEAVAETAGATEE